MMPVFRVHCKRLVSLHVSKAGGRGTGGTYCNIMQLLEIQDDEVKDSLWGTGVIFLEQTRILKIPITSTDLS